MQALTQDLLTGQDLGNSMSTYEIVQCFHCKKEFSRYKTTAYSLINCPYCSGPNYQGNLSNNTIKFQFEQAVLNYQYQQGMNQAPGLENPYYQPIHQPASVQPSPSRVPSTNQRGAARSVGGYGSSYSYTQINDTKKPPKDNNTKDWAEWIEKLVVSKIDQETNSLRQEVSLLKQEIQSKQEQIEQLERQIQVLQIPQKNKGDSSETAPSSLGSNPKPEPLEGYGGPLDVDSENPRKPASQPENPEPLSQCEEGDHSSEDNGERCIEDEKSAEIDSGSPISVRYSFTPEWVKNYNLLSLSGGRDEATSFASQYYAKEVAQTEASLNQSWVGQKEGIYFEANSNTGSYWLISSLGQRQSPVYHIVPNKRKFRFMEGTLSAMEVYFDFQIAGTDNSQPFNPEDADTLEFQVIYPAEVLEVVPQQQWQLQHKGLLEFQPRKEEST